MNDTETVEKLKARVKKCETEIKLLKETVNKLELIRGGWPTRGFSEE